MCGRRSLYPLIWIWRLYPNTYMYTACYRNINFKFHDQWSNLLILIPFGCCLIPRTCRNQLLLVKHIIVKTLTVFLLSTILKIPSYKCQKREKKTVFSTKWYWLQRTKTDKQAPGNYVFAIFSALMILVMKLIRTSLYHFILNSTNKIHTHTFYMRPQPFPTVPYFHLTVPLGSDPWN